MAQLLPLAAAGTASTVGATAGAAALAKGAALAGGSSLASGLAAGTALGTGAAMGAMPALSYAGANLAAPGLLGALPAAAPTAGIFAKAAPALGGLQSLTPAASGFKSLAMANAPLTAPSSFGAVNQAVGLGDIGAKAAAPQLTKASYLTQGAGPSVPSIEARQFADLASAGSKGTGLRMPTGVEGLRLSPEAAQTALTPAASPIQAGESALSNLGNLIQNPSMQGLKDYVKEHPYASAGLGYSAYNMLKPDRKPPEQDKGMIRPYKLERGPRQEAYAVSPLTDTSERRYFTDEFIPLEPYPADSEEAKKASGGIASAYAVGGPVEQMSAMNAVGDNTMYPQSQFQTPVYSNPMIQRPVQTNVIAQGLDAPVDPYTGEQKLAEGGEAKTEGGYKYSFDPQTQTFTQLSAPRPAGQSQGRGQEYTRYTGEGRPPGDDYYYMPGTMAGSGYFMTRGAPEATPRDTGPKISGGIAAPVGGPSMASPVQPVQPAQPPINVPGYRSPEERLGLTDFYKMMNQQLAQQGGYAAGGGVSDLGSYSDGGRLLKGPGDGVSDSIPAVIGKRQPARLADGEFVIPARIVSELGNGSTEAGARKLYAMMERVQKGRRKSVGKDKVAVDSKADKHLPA